MMPDLALADQLPARALDLQFIGAEDLEGLLQGLRAAPLAGIHPMPRVFAPFWPDRLGAPSLPAAAFFGFATAVLPAAAAALAGVAGALAAPLGSFGAERCHPAT